jgi:hypothetical protein
MRIWAFFEIHQGGFSLSWAPPDQFHRRERAVRQHSGWDDRCLEVLLPGDEKYLHLGSDHPDPAQPLSVTLWEPPQTLKLGLSQLKTSGDVENRLNIHNSGTVTNPGLWWFQTCSFTLVPWLFQEDSPGNAWVLFMSLQIEPTLVVQL